MQISNVRVRFASYRSSAVSTNGHPRVSSFSFANNLSRFIKDLKKNKSPPWIGTMVA